MATSDFFWARGDSSTAANAEINIRPLNQQSSVQIQFESGTLGANTTGDLVLDDTAAGVPDPDTTVWINGTEYQFIYELQGTWPAGNGKVPDQYEGDPVYVITVLGAGPGGSNIRLFFLPDPTVTQADIESFGNGAVPLTTFTTNPPPPVCFLRGTLIATPRGEVPVEDLKAGDEVLTASGDVAKVRFVASRRVSDAELVFRPDMRPVCIPASALGDGLPNADLWVSPQHRVLVRGWEAEMLFGENEVLVPAKHLRIAAVAPVQPETVEYVHLMLDRHDIVLSNGIATESLFPGDTAIASLTAEARAEMERAFPEFAGDWAFYGPTARRTLTGREAQTLWTRMAPLGAAGVRAVA
ncbi:Hint domain-containing protein [Albidovulum sediminis]|uniref:Hint domain-containing protein n=1 Tax=Albidovulum sediminis TaxID=3066345 RepID=A0ABT2NM53_9RHOB|nr:Hint domain-containing protein [Defluviimonas sediminis]MCT8330018.1 Hint domain-containing protein [Defluviimonas sediminis]